MFSWFDGGAQVPSFFDWQINGELSWLVLGIESVEVETRSLSGLKGLFR